MSTDQATLRSGAADFFARDWRRIITTRPPAVRDHLAAERVLADQILAGSAYRTLVEVGCSDGSLLLPAALRHGLAYLGLDLAAGAVAATREALTAATREALTAAAPTAAAPTAGAPRGPSARAVQADVDDLGAVLADLPEPLLWPLLVGFPFNVFGNLPDPRRTLAAVAGTRADVVILTYDTSPRARAARIEYYLACGLPGRVTDDAAGSHFAFGAFASSVYHPARLTGWLAAQGYRVRIRRYGAVGLAYHGVLGRP